jgi:hypothetical protein
MKSFKMNSLWQIEAVLRWGGFWQGVLTHGKFSDGGKVSGGRSWCGIGTIRYQTTQVCLNNVEKMATLPDVKKTACCTPQQFFLKITQ